jgi:hypothetical protein
MNIFEEIRAGQLQSEDMIKKSLPIDIGTVVEDIKKAKAAQIGEIRTWSGVKMRKEANGWVPVKDGEGGQKKEEEGKIKEAGPEDLAEHARNASETALMNATKVSGDPAVREAAHKELLRRKGEEAQETFKAPGGAEGGAKPEASVEGKKTEPKKEEIKKEGEKKTSNKYVWSEEVRNKFFEINDHGIEEVKLRKKFDESESKNGWNDETEDLFRKINKMGEHGVKLKREFDTMEREDRNKFKEEQKN